MAVICLVAAVSIARAEVPSDPGPAIDAAIDQGDAWNVAIPKVAAILGPPAIASDDHIEWALMVKDMSVHVVATADSDGFVQSVDTKQSSNLDTEGWPPCKKLLGSKAPGTLSRPGNTGPLAAGTRPHVNVRCLSLGALRSRDNGL